MRISVSSGPRVLLLCFCLLTPQLFISAPLRGQEAPEAAPAPASESASVPASESASDPGEEPAAPRPLSDSERRGKRLYLTGESASGEEVQALLGGESGVEVPASSLPCSGCHGRDGRGKPEGGIAPSDITWSALTRPYGVTHDDGRKHPPYDERGVIKALTLGVDPAGNPLDAVMPRYRLSKQDADDLTAYLKRLEDDRDPGVGEETLRVGTLLPGATELRSTMEGTLQALIDDLNENGGIWGRKLELVAIPTLGEPTVRADQARYFLDHQEPFALVAPYLVGAEEALRAALGERSVPAVGALALDPDLSFPVERGIFYLYLGREGQVDLLLARLAAQAAESGEGGEPWAIVRPMGAASYRAAQTIKQRYAPGGGDGPGLPEPEDLTYEPGALDARALSARLERSGARSVLFLGEGPDGRALAAALGEAGLAPRLLAPGYGAAPALLAGVDGFGGKVWGALPTTPADFSPEAVARLGELLGEGKETDLNRALVQLSVYGAFRLFTEGLRRTGRDLSREGLIETLEGLYRFETGVTRPLTYGPDRRIGAAGAYVIEAEGGTGKVLGAGWREGDG